MPDEFKEKPTIAKYLKMFKDIRKNIKENLNTDIFLTNPFAAAAEKHDEQEELININENLKKNSSSKRVLMKWGQSFETKELILKENQEYEKYKKENNKTITEAEVHKNETFSYKKILESIIINQYPDSDFRKQILTECITNNEDFKDYDFEKFVIYLESFISLFSGIQCKYFIDELGCLNMDFYSSDTNLMSLAELNHYQLQFKIMNLTQVVKYNNHNIEKNDKIRKIQNEAEENKNQTENVIKNKIENIDHNCDVNLPIKMGSSEIKYLKNNQNNEFNIEITEPLLGNKEETKEDEIKEKKNTQFEELKIEERIMKKNNTQYEELDIEDVTLFPVFTNFTKKTAHFFRRYDKYDNYHMCNECLNLKEANESYHLKCSSIFREIDKTRIIYAFLNNIINIPLIKTPDKKNINLKQVFKFVLVLHDYQELNNQDYTKLVKVYLHPTDTTEVKKFNKVFKNKFGEDIGMYFTWVTHYIKWLIFPAVLGLLLYTIGHFLSWMTDSFVYMYFNLVFAGVIMLWANLYLTSWKSLEKLLLQIWGMNSFKIDKSNEITDIPLDKWDFMGIRMPIIDSYMFHKRRIWSFFVIFLSLLTTIALNVLIFYIENAQLYADTSIGNKELKMISNGYWLYITPVCTYFMREYMSSVYRNIALDLTNKEIHIHKDNFNASLKLKIIFFEFFNYYFNLYYIAFVKRYFETCPMNDCYSLLAQQLTGILTSAVIVDFTKLFWNAIYKRNIKKKFESNLKENNPNVKNKSSKYIYYTRAEYEASDMTGEYLEIVLNFGYIIQFGASSPICFFIALLQTIAMRLMDVIKFSKLQYCRLISESHGIGIFHKVMKLMTFLGLITNVCIIFFTDTHIVNVDLATKLLILFVVENAVLIIMMMASYTELPFWFNFKDKIEVTYLKKYTSDVSEYKDKHKDHNHKIE